MAIDRDYKISPSARTCQACRRRFGVGDEYYSAVVEAEGDDLLARRDFCPDCWAPDAADAYFSFWKTRVPEPPADRRSGPRLVDLDRLLQLFDHLAAADEEHARRFRYVLALVLMRKRRLRLVASRRLAAGQGEELTLREVGSQRQHTVRCPSLSEDEIRSVTDRLGDILDMPQRWDELDAGAEPAADAESESDAEPAPEAASPERAVGGTSDSQQAPPDARAPSEPGAACEGEGHTLSF